MWVISVTELTLIFFVSESEKYVSSSFFSLYYIKKIVLIFWKKHSRPTHLLRLIIAAAVFVLTKEFLAVWWSYWKIFLQQRSDSHQRLTIKQRIEKKLNI